MQLGIVYNVSIIGNYRYSSLYTVNMQLGIVYTVSIIDIIDTVYADPDWLIMCTTIS